MPHAGLFFIRPHLVRASPSVCTRRIRKNGRPWTIAAPLATVPRASNSDAPNPPFVTVAFGSSAVSVSVLFDGFRFLSADPSGRERTRATAAEALVVVTLYDCGRRSF